MTTCICRSIILTGSLDGWLLIYNYVLDLVVQKLYFGFNKLINCSLHPSGLYLIAATRDGLNIIIIRSDKVTANTELDFEYRFSFVLNYEDTLKYSNGGDKIVFTENNNHIFVIKTIDYTIQERFSFKKTNYNIKIKELQFSNDDNYLIGSLEMIPGRIVFQLWHSNSLIPIYEIDYNNCNLYRINVTSKFIVHPFKSSFFSIENCKLNEYELPKPLSALSLSFCKEPKDRNEIKLINSYHIINYNDANDEFITCLTINKCGRLIIIGTNMGHLRVYKLTENNFIEESNLNYGGHTKSVKTVSIIDNDNLLVTGYDDGTLIIWSIGRLLCDNSKHKYLNSNNNNVLANTKDLMSQMFDENGSELNYDANLECLMNYDQLMEQHNNILLYEEKLNKFDADIKLRLRIKQIQFEIKSRELKYIFYSQMERLEVNNEINKHFFDYLLIIR
jgi:hypothetical protein